MGFEWAFYSLLFPLLRLSSWVQIDQRVEVVVEYVGWHNGLGCFLASMIKYVGQLSGWTGSSPLRSSILVGWQIVLPGRLYDWVELSGWNPSSLWSSRTAEWTASSLYDRVYLAEWTTWSDCFPLYYLWSSMLVGMWLSVLFFLFLNTNSSKVPETTPESRMYARLVL